jgi:protein-disulfide isomerase
MKALIKGTALTLALLLAGCGGDEGGNGGGKAASNAPLTQIQAPNGDWTAVVSETPEGGFVMGNPNAPVKLVEYASITCPHCAEFTEEASEPLKNRYVKSGQVSWEYRPYMLFPTDPGIFMLLRCQGAGPFFQLTDQLYASQPQWMAKLQQLPEAELQRLQAMPAKQRAAALAKAAGMDQFFRQRGMPQARIDACLADQQALQRLVEITNVGTTQHGVGGTPTFLINNTLVELDPNRGVWEQLEPKVRGAIG